MLIYYVVLSVVIFGSQKKTHCLILFVCKLVALHRDLCSHKGVGHGLKHRLCMALHNKPLGNRKHKQKTTKST